MAMEAKHFLPGDVVEYVKPEHMEATRRTVKRVGPFGESPYGDTLGLWNTSGMWMRPGNVVLVERDGKKVKSIVQSQNGWLLIEYRAGKTQYFGMDARWRDAGYTGQDMIDKFPANKWEHIYQAEEEPTPILTALSDLARERGYEHMVPAINALEVREIKWPKGATVQNRFSSPNRVFCLKEDVYEGDVYFNAPNFPDQVVTAYRRVEIKVVD